MHSCRKIFSIFDEALALNQNFIHLRFNSIEINHWEVWMGWNSWFQSNELACFQLHKGLGDTTGLSSNQVLNFLHDEVILLDCVFVVHLHLHSTVRVQELWPHWCPAKSPQRELLVQSMPCIHDIAASSTGFVSGGRANKKFLLPNGNQLKHSIWIKLLTN